MGINDVRTESDSCEDIIGYFEPSNRTRGANGAFRGEVKGNCGCDGGEAEMAVGGVG